MDEQPTTDLAADVRPQTLDAIARHLEARAVSILRPDSVAYAEYHAVAALLRRLADEPPCRWEHPHPGYQCEPHAAGEQPECAASASGNCLAEAQSETACGTDDGECVHGGRLAPGPSVESWARTLAGARVMGRGGLPFDQLTGEEQDAFRKEARKVVAAQVPEHPAQAGDVRRAREALFTAATGTGRMSEEEAFQHLGVLTPSVRHGGHRGRCCPQCDEDLSSYEEDDLVYLKGNDHPYCSMECVIVAYRAALRSRADDGPSPVGGVKGNPFDCHPEDGEAVCRCGHKRKDHDAKYADPQCRLCPEDGERMWRHKFTPADAV